MAADFVSKFGLPGNYYTYQDACGFALGEIDIQHEFKLLIADTPGMPRGYAAGSLPSPTGFTVTGSIRGSSLDNWRTRVDNFVAAHGEGIKRFYEHSDRFRYAMVRRISSLKADSSRRWYTNFTVDFHCHDPFYYADSATATSSLASGGTITNGGTRTTKSLVLTVAVSSIGTNGYITLTNSTTGEAFVLTPDATGTFTIDMEAETVSRSSVLRPATASGKWLRLQAGANTLAVATSGGAAVSSISSSHRNVY